MFKIIVTTNLALLLTFSTLVGAMGQEPKSGPQTIRFYKVNKQFQANRLRFTNKKAGQAGCHDMTKRTRVHRAVQIGYAQCQLFTEKACLASSVVKVSQDNKAQLIEDAEERRQEILNRIVQERESKERYEERELERLADEEMQAKLAALAQNSDTNVDTSPLEEVDSVDTIVEIDEPKERPKKDYEAIETGLKAQLESVASREQIVNTVPDTLTTDLSQGFAWYPDSDNLRGVKIKSWSCL